MVDNVSHALCACGHVHVTFYEGTWQNLLRATGETLEQLHSGITMASDYRINSIFFLWLHLWLLYDLTSPQGIAMSRAKSKLDNQIVSLTAHRALRSISQYVVDNVPCALHACGHVLFYAGTCQNLLIRWTLTLRSLYVRRGGIFLWKND